jgi:hypothetical protein
MIESLNFLYYEYPCKGQVVSEKLTFDPNLNRFVNQVDYFCGLEDRDKIPSQEAYQQIKIALAELRLSENN